MRCLGIDVGEVHLGACLFEAVPLKGPHPKEGDCTYCNELPPPPQPTSCAATVYGNFQLGPGTGGDNWWHITVRKQHFAISILSWRLLDLWESVLDRALTLKEGIVQGLSTSDTRSKVKDAGSSCIMARGIAPLLAEWSALEPDVVVVEQQVMSVSRFGKNKSDRSDPKYNERMKVLHGVIRSQLDGALECPVYDKHGRNTTTMVWDLHENHWWPFGDCPVRRGTKGIAKPIKKSLAQRAVAGCLKIFGAKDDEHTKHGCIWQRQVWEANTVKFDLADSCLHGINLVAMLKCRVPVFGQDEIGPDALPITLRADKNLIRSKKRLRAIEGARLSLEREGLTEKDFPTWLLEETECTKKIDWIDPRPVPKKRKKKPTKAKPWCVYLLVSTVSNKTYIGASNDPDRRLRQHNGEIKGGAASTRTKRPYRTVARVWGFGPIDSYALRFETAFRNECKRGCSGPSKRLDKLKSLLSRWKPPTCTPLTLHVAETGDCLDSPSTTEMGIAIPSMDIDEKDVDGALLILEAMNK